MAMKLILREFETFPAHTCLEAEPGTFKIDYEGIVDIGRVTVDLDIQQSGEEFFCQGDVKADVTLECARCLTRFKGTLDGATDFIVCSHDTWEEQHAEAQDDEDYVFYEGRSLEADITEPVRQAIIIAMPLAPLCREDCKGLCPKCKVNRNEQECTCTFDEVDPRWSKLKDLRGDND